MKKRTLAGLSVVAVASLALSVQAQNRDTRAEFEQLIERYVKERSAGGPAYDPDGFGRRMVRQKAFLEEFRSIPPNRLDREQQVDRLLVIGQLQGTIREQEARRPLETNPELYLQLGAIARLMDQDDLLPGDHAKTMAGRLNALPEVLGHGRRNLKHPPEDFTRAAIFQADEWIQFLSGDLAAHIKRTAAGREQLQAASNRAEAALKEYRQFLQDELLPRSTGSWAIGRELYDYLLQQRWFMKDDAASILAKGHKGFADTERLAQELASRMEPGKHWTEVYERIKDDHPPADRIKETYQRHMAAAQVFVRDRRIVTLPPGERVITIDTPPAMRRSSPFGTFRSVGPFDTHLEGALVLTPIEEHLTPEQRRERLRSHHHAWIPIIAVHEAYPGHHVQALRSNENPRILRKITRESIFSEGWGLFTEELMWEQGFLKGDDVRLTQLRNRLWRAARVIIDVGLHTGTMTFEQGVDFLVEKVRFERYAAELEVGMYTRRPTYVLGYLIGMMEIEAMRAEYNRRFGQPKEPREFYDRLLRIGSLPPSLVRAELLGEPLP